MRTKDLVVGEDYAFSRRRSSVYAGNPRMYVERVTVLSTAPLTVQTYQYTESGQSKRKADVKQVQPQNLHFTWAEHQAALKARTEHQASAAEQGQQADTTVRELLGATKQTEGGFGSWTWADEDGKRHYLDQGTKVYADGSMSNGRYHLDSVEFAQALRKAYLAGRASLGQED